MLGTLLLIILILVLVGCLPNWPHSKNWGYKPASIALTILFIYLILIGLGVITM